ncbi:MAG TPA: response regulator [Anaerolineales bacterium]
MTKILIVEDELDTIQLVRRILMAYGFDIVQASTAEDGLARARAENPDLILLDLGLPDYDGQTLAGWLRDDPTLQTTLIVAFTAWPVETVQKMAESYGCAGYIGKPIVSANHFVEQIKSFLLPLEIR